MFHALSDCGLVKVVEAFPDPTNYFGEYNAIKTDKNDSQNYRNKTHVEINKKYNLKNIYSSFSGLESSFYIWILTFQGKMLIVFLIQQLQFPLGFPFALPSARPRQIQAKRGLEPVCISRMQIHQSPQQPAIVVASKDRGMIREKK